MIAALGNVSGFVGSLALCIYFGYQLYLRSARKEALHGLYFVVDRSFAFLWIGLALLAVSAALCAIRLMLQGQGET